MRRILCLYLPNWPIQRLLAGRKASESRRAKIEGRRANQGSNPFILPPSSFIVILHAREARRGDVVVAANSAAYKLGVRLNMPLAEAAALAEPGDKCFIRPHDPAADLRALARLAEHCERFSPIVGWQTVEGPKSKVQSPKSSANFGSWTLDLGQEKNADCLFLDVTGIGVLFGGEENLAREVVVDLVRLGYQAHVVVADTIGAAWAAANLKSSPGIQVLSTEYSVLSTELPEFQRTSDHQFPLPLAPHSALRTLPLESLRLPQETIALLNQLGITQLDQLLALPRESLRSRFGERLLLRVDQLLGAAQEMIVPHRPPPQFAEEWLLEYPSEQREVVERIVHELVGRIANALGDRREGVVQLECRIDCAPGRPLFLKVGLFRPSADKQHLCDLMRMRLEQTTLPGSVGRVRLEATLTAPLENRQGELFTGNEQGAARQFALLIDRCSSRLGPEAVLCPQLTADPLPERGVKYRAGGGRQGARSRSQKSEVRGRRSRCPVLSTSSIHSSNSLHSAVPAPRSALLRPLLLHSPPLEINAVSIAPDGPPVWFELHGQRHHVAHHFGPERIETGWWRGKSVRRDYWRVETDTGQRFWLFRDLADGRWSLHGEYA